MAGGVLGHAAGHLLHLVAWAQVGVAVRVTLDGVLGYGCDPALPMWMPCLTSNGGRLGGAVFADLPANVLGSFLMGLFVSSDVLSNSLKHTLSVEAPLAALPTWSPLQTHAAFQVGLRTGLCGSLTTYASWQLQMVVMLVGGDSSPLGSQYLEAVGGLVVGTLCSCAALVLGQHVALAIYHRLNPGALIPYGSPAPEQLLLEEPSARAEASVTDVRVVRQTSVRTVGGHTIVVLEDSPAEARPRMPSAASLGVPVYSSPSPPESQQGSALLQDSPFAAAAAAADGVAASGNSLPPAASWRSAVSRGSGSFAAAAGPGAPAAKEAHGLAGAQSPSLDTNAVVSEELDEGARPAAWRLTSVLLADAFAALCTAVLTATSIWRIVGSSLGRLNNIKEPFDYEWLCWAIVLGPLGCLLRFHLARYNGALPSARWRWFPAGTFAANMAACVLDYSLKAVEVRVPLNQLQVAVIHGTTMGVGGCLSTVSTWVVEIQRLMLSFPNTSHGYQYVAISLATSMSLGLLVYGVPVWTM